MKAISILFILLSSFNLHARESFSLMAYNVENLFDTKHDQDKDDWTFLPQLEKWSMDRFARHCDGLSGHNRDLCFNVDWTESNFQKKLKQISKVILSYNQNLGADVLVLAEIENTETLSKLVQKINEQLPEEKKYHYQVLVEGPDQRGIDQAVVSRFEISHVKGHEVDLSQIVAHAATRQILEVSIKVNDQHVAIFANHWPSQAKPDEARFKAAKVLEQYAKIAAQTHNLVIATGDFNTLPNEFPSGLELKIAPIFYDAHEEKSLLGHNVFPGTNYHYGHWNHLDRIFVYKDTASTFQPNWSTFKVWAKDFMMESSSTKAPLRYDFFRHRGYSDHYPVVLEFQRSSSFNNE